MPAVASGKVLVTGANGFVAMWIVDSLLKQGYAVRAVVRAESKGVHILQTFAAYGDQLELVVVEDFIVEGAFDKAVAGVDAIMHTASPVKLHQGDPNEVILPSVRGATSLLNSVISHGSSVKRVVYTSTAGAVLTPSPEPKVFSEKDWNDFAVRHCQEKGPDSVPSWTYCASKVLAERAAWDIYEQQKAEKKWELVVIIPPWVFGPVLNPASTPESLNISMAEFYNAIFKGTKSDAQLAQEGGGWIDVRDLADIHVKAIASPEAGGERIIVSAGTWKWQDWVNIARTLSENAIVGNTSYNPNNAIHMFNYDLSKMKNVIGAPARSKQETMADIVKDFESKGWLDSSVAARQSYPVSPFQLA